MTYSRRSWMLTSLSRVLRNGAQITPGCKREWLTWFIRLLNSTNSALRTTTWMCNWASARNSFRILWSNSDIPSLVVWSQEREKQRDNRELSCYEWTWTECYTRLIVRWRRASKIYHHSKKDSQSNFRFWRRGRRKSKLPLISLIKLRIHWAANIQTQKCRLEGSTRSARLRFSTPHLSITPLWSPWRSFNLKL